MEDYRGKFCVIFAGYKNEMLQMLSTNPGLKSRIQFTLDFPNYSRDELKSITELMLEKRGYTIGSGAMNRILDITDIKRKEPNFANAREIRNILDQVIMCQNLRCAGTDDKELGIVDVNQYIRDAKINLPTTGDGLQNAILTGEEELDQLIGLAPVKRMIKKIKAYAKKNKGQADFNLHMCFYGNPGTGKTEVARILSRILYDAGVLDEAKLVETDGQGLLGKFVGETAPKTEAKINDAMNGVLFIDEAYSLTGNHTAGGAANFGDEAIAVLLKEMEDHRGQFCVILAGYKNEMKEMLSANPGFISRIQFTLEFPDYTREELGEIASVFLKKKKYSIDNDAMERLLDVTEYYRNRPNFANARTVRNIIDQVIMNQNLRTEDTEDDDVIMIEDVDDYITDEGIDLTSSAPKRKIGF
jgi:AAA+ superfamily predicted ATPase